MLTSIQVACTHVHKLLCWIRIHIQYSVWYMCSNLTWDHIVGEWVHKRQCTTLMTMEQHITCIMKHMYMYVMQFRGTYSVHVCPSNV